MRVKAFELERWFALYEFEVENNLCASCAEETTTADLLELAGPKRKNEYLNLPLDYVPNPGTSKLRQEIASLYSGLTIEQIRVTTGASEAIFLLNNILLRPGDNLVVQYPIYQSLFSIAESMGAEVRAWKMRDQKNFIWDTADLKELIDSRTKLVVVNNPHSPTGAIMSLGQLQEIVSIIEKNGIYLLSDEVYHGLVYEEDNLLPPAVTLSEMAISIGDITKPYGLGGLRIGWIASNNSKLLASCSALRDYTTMCSSAPGEFLAVLALEHRKEILIRKIKLAKQNLELLEQFVFNNSELISFTKPKGGVSAFLNYKLNLNSRQFCGGLVQRESTLLLPGAVFGCEYYFRLGFGGEKKKFATGLASLERYINFLKLQA